MADQEQEGEPMPIAKPQKVELNGQQTCHTLHNFNVEIYPSESSAKGDISSHKVTVVTITNQVWAPVDHHGNMIATSNQYLAYVLESKSGYAIRIIQQETNNRALLKKFVGRIIDVAFAHADSNILAALDEGGNLHVYNLDMAHGDVDKFSACKTVHVHQSSSSVDRLQHRLAWCPYVPPSEGEDLEETLMIALAHGSTVEVLDLAEIMNQFPAQFPIPREKITDGVVVIPESHQLNVNDLSLSPDGNVLATASTDGLVKFWKLNMDSKSRPVCLHECYPHGGAPVTRIIFCDNLLTQNPNTQFWRFLVTAAKENSEIKLWCTVKWTCLQTISFLHPSDSISHPRMVLGLDLSASYLFVADTSRMVFYIIPINQETAIGDASFSSVTEYLLTQPILKFVISGRPLPLHTQEESEEDDEDEDDRKEIKKAAEKELNARRDVVQIKLHCMQTKSIQQMTVQFDPPDVFGIPPCPDNTPSKASSFVATVTQDETRPIDLPPLEDSVPSTTPPHRVLLTPSSFVLGGNSAVTTPPTSFANLISKPLLSPQDMASSVISSSLTTISTICGSVENESVPFSSWGTSSFLLGASNDGALSSLVSTEGVHVHGVSQLPPHPLLCEQQVAQSPAISLSGLPATTTMVGFSPSMPSTTNAGSDAEASTGIEGRGDLVTQPLRFRTCSSSEEGDEFVVTPMTGQPVLGPTTEENAHFPVALDYTSSDLSTVYSSAKEDETVQEQEPQGEATSLPALLTTATGGGEPEIGFSDLPGDVQEKDKGLDSDSEKEKYTPQGTPKGSDVEEEVGVAAECVEPTWQIEDAYEKETEHLSDPTLVDTDLDHRPLNQEEVLTEDVTHPSEMAQVEILSMDRDEQSTEHSAPEAADAFISQQQPVDKDLNDAEERPLEETGDQNVDAWHTISTDQAEPRKEHFQAGVVTVETSLLARLLEAVTQQQHELQALRREHQEGMQAMQTHMESVLSTLLQVNRDEQKEQNKELQHRIERQLKAMESKRAEKLSQSLQLAISAPVSSKLEKTLKQEMKNTVTPVLQHGVQMLGEQWRASMDQQMHEAVLQVLHTQGLGESIVSCVTHSLQQVMREQFSNVFATSTLPSFERACLHMYQQVDEAFRRGTAEYLGQLQQQRDPVLQQISSAVHALPASITSSTTTSFQTILQHQLGALTVHLQQAINDMVTSIAQEHARRGPDEELALRKKQLVEFVKKQQFEQAFNIALSTENLQLVLYLCEELPSEDLFEISPCPLSQPVLLSLIQQLSVDLIDKLEVKIKYLESSILSLDTDNEVTRTHMHHVLEVLSQQLTELEETMQTKAVSGSKPKMLKAVRRVRLMTGHLCRPK